MRKTDEELLSELIRKQELKDRKNMNMEYLNAVLDKIRAEIIWYRDNRLSYEANSETIELTNYYLGVIDKYREVSVDAGRR